MNLNFDQLNEEEMEILKHAKDLPLELRLKVLQSKDQPENRKTHQTSKTTEYVKKKRRRGGPAEISAKQKVYQNKVNQNILLKINFFS